MNRDIEKDIREDWFKDHVATLKDLGEIQILEWGKPGTICYYVRYVFDGCRMYITGDLGEAVFCLTWKASVHSFNNIYIGYFAEKLAAYHGDEWDFNSENAVKRLREWVKELKSDGIKYEHEPMKELFEAARGSSQEWEWVEAIHANEAFIADLEADYWEWFHKIGREYPSRLRSYLIGLQMASSQLKEAPIP